MKKHLEGVRVIDLTAYLSGPFVSLNLAAMGAEVIKVERPKIGDPCRWNPPFAGPDGVGYRSQSDTDVSLLYLKRNRGKKSVFLNMRDEKGKKILEQLVEKGDILIENFAPGSMSRLGFDYERLKEINPQIIYCSISGYGQDGPYKNRTAFDLTIQGTSGLMGVTGFPDGPPTRCGAWIGDMIPSMYALSAILAALYSREKTGKGERIDISMQDCCFSMIMDEALDFHLDQGIPMRTGNRNPRLAPWNAYPARDGHVIICVANNVQWEAFVDAIGREDLKEDPRFQNQEGRFKNSDVIERIVLDWLKNLGVEDALKRLREKRVACDSVSEIPEVLSDPQLKSRGMIQELAHPKSGKTGIKTAGFPVHFTEAGAGLDTPAPFPGQHNEEIYKGLLGISEAEMLKLKDEEII
ncbi:MAG: CoA transferase [Deltaproteobacteria bacterium]|jgi:crotonobetainyl-CoA:carnitine CoA-transferase CaiB-like acyl-CoA transferase